VFYLVGVASIQEFSARRKNKKSKKLAIKFKVDTYWNPAEWVSRSLFRDLVELPEITNTRFESELKNKVERQIELYVWLLDFESAEPYQLEILKELVETSTKRIEIKEECQVAYFEKIRELLELIKNQITGPIKKSKWNYIKGWEGKGEITKLQLEEWAFSENGIFQDQDEDLLLYNPNLIEPMFNLLGTKWCKRNNDLKKILLNYYHYNVTRRKNEIAMMNFEKLLTTKNPNEYQKEIIEKINPAENNG
jgi:hypothetical protein